jgi:hypothetical protein
VTLVDYTVTTVAPEGHPNGGGGAHFPHRVTDLVCRQSGSLTRLCFANGSGYTRQRALEVRTGALRRYGARNPGPRDGARMRPNAAPQVRRTTPPARRAHSSRAIVPTRSERAIPTATPRSCRSPAPGERSATAAIIPAGLAFTFAHAPQRRRWRLFLRAGGWHLSVRGLLVS